MLNKTIGCSALWNRDGVAGVNEHSNPASTLFAVHVSTFIHSPSFYASLKFHGFMDPKMGSLCHKTVYSIRMGKYETCLTVTQNLVVSNEGNDRTNVSGAGLQREINYAIERASFYLLVRPFCVFCHLSSVICLLSSVFCLSCPLLSLPFKCQI